MSAICVKKTKIMYQSKKIMYLFLKHFYTVFNLYLFNNFSIKNKEANLTSFYSFAYSISALNITSIKKTNKKLPP